MPFPTQELKITGHLDSPSDAPLLEEQTDS
jgi:hypothetical protein